VRCDGFGGFRGLSRLIFLDAIALVLHWTVSILTPSFRGFGQNLDDFATDAFHFGPGVFLGDNLPFSKIEILDVHRVLSDQDLIFNCPRCELKLIRPAATEKLSSSLQ